MATVKEINHDSGPPIGNHYSSVTDTDGAITVNNASALNGSTFGLEMDYDAGANTVILAETFVFSATELRMRFRVNINTLTFGGAGLQPLKVKLITSGSSFEIFVLQISGDPGPNDFKLGTVITTDSGTSSAGTGYSFSANDTCIELRAIRETSAIAADGEFQVFVDGVSVANASNLDNFATWNDVIDTVQLEFGSPAAWSGTLYYDQWILDNVNTTDLCVIDTTLSLAAMTKPADVNAGGTFIYAALLEGGTPILTKISTALDADGTTVFDPGGGDNIGVECGRFNSDVVWVAGNFDGTNVVEKSEDAGSSFTVKDDATIGDVRTFVMGPDSDERILIFDETNGDILETFDDGATWTAINAAVVPEVNAIGRLGKNVQESVFGNAGAGSDNVDYSVNSGANLEDLALPVNQDITRVIIN